MGQVGVQLGAVVYATIANTTGGYVNKSGLVQRCTALPFAIGDSQKHLAPGPVRGCLLRGKIIIIHGVLRSGQTMGQYCVGNFSSRRRSCGQRGSGTNC